MMETGEGEVRGIARALGGWFSRYRAGRGRCSISPLCYTTLPQPLWATWSWIERATSGNLAAGSSGDVTVFTVPADERVELHWFYAQRATGDNTISALALTAPTGYGSGSRYLTLIAPAAAATPMWWPNRTTTVTYEIPPGGQPVLLEPGTTLQVSGGGVGAAITTYDIILLLRRTSLIRSRAP